VETTKDEEPTENAIVGLAATPDGKCFAATQTGLLKSNDFGDTWESAFASLADAGSIPVTAVALSPSFDLDGTLFAAIPGGIGRSSDQGEQWDFVALPLPIQIISAFAISPDFTHDRIIFASTTDDGVLRSEDGGVSWQAWNFGLLDHNVLSLAISPDFARDRTILAGTSSGLFRSVNSGKSWQTIDLDRGFAEIIGLVSYADSSFVAIADESALYRSTDLSQTWTRLDTPSETIQTITASADSIVVVTDEAILRSCDLGESWETIAPNPDSVTAATLIGDHHLLIGTASGELQMDGLATPGVTSRGQNPRQT
jgi:photosystem II stability/assembly factor-like uncharacterized protein